MSEEICGVSKDKIRKAYFKGAINKLLTDIQASGDYTPEDYTALKDYFATLQDRDDKLSAEFSDFMPQLDTTIDGDSMLGDLNTSLSESEVAELEREKANRETAVSYAGRMLKSLFAQFHDKRKPSPTDDELKDMSFEMLSLKYFLVRDTLYKKQLYQKRIIDIEKTGKQRKLAEDYAKTETAYREYILAERLEEMSQELINNCKKFYHEN